MKIDRLANGWRITIPATEINCEFTYNLPIMKDGPEWIRAEQKRVARRFAIRAFAMENQFKGWRKPGDFEAWAEKNRVVWNEWFHDSMADLSEAAWALYREWCDWHWKTYGFNAY
jgi:hypothetical protein